MHERLDELCAALWGVAERGLRAIQSAYRALYVTAPKDAVEKKHARRRKCQRLKFTLICDESGTSDRHLVVGALTLPRTNHPLLVKEIQELKQTLGFRPEGEINGARSARNISAATRR